MNAPHVTSERSFHVGVDLGTTYTAAAVCRLADQGRPEPVTLGSASTAIPTVAFLTDDGSLLIGEPALRRAMTEPRQLARGFKRRIGDETPLILGDQSIPAADIAARFVRSVVDDVTAREGTEPDSIALTHPASWGEHELGVLSDALARQGLTDVTMLSEPEAAALCYSASAELEPDSAVAVYDLGGGTFDAAVIGHGPDGERRLLGRPVGLDHVGGLDFDERVLDHVRAALGTDWTAPDPDDPAARTAVAALRRECTAAKETLSVDVETFVPVMLPGTHTRVRLGRAEFEEMIRPAVAETVEALRRAVASAETEPADLHAVLLVGGSSRIPLVSQMVSAELGRPVTVDADPKTVVAMGAALRAYRIAHPEVARPDDEPEPAPVAPPGAEGTEGAVSPRAVTPPQRTRLRATVVAAVVTAGLGLTAVAAFTLDRAPTSAVPAANQVGTTTGVGAAAPTGDSDVEPSATADPAERPETAALVGHQSVAIPSTATPVVAGLPVATAGVVPAPVAVPAPTRTVTTRTTTIKATKTKVPSPVTNPPVTNPPVTDPPVVTVPPTTDAPVDPNPPVTAPPGGAEGGTAAPSTPIALAPAPQTPEVAQPVVAAPAPAAVPVATPAVT